MAGTEDAVDLFAKCVEYTFCSCKLNEHAYTSCAARCAKGGDGLRRGRELTGADAGAKASRMVAD
eukprot:3483713-Pyramimonas_sp.AAC.1